MSRGNIVKTVRLGIGWQHFFQFQPRGRQQISHRVFILDWIQPSAADTAVLRVPILPSGEQSIAGDSSEFRNRFRFRPCFILRRHFTGSNSIENLRPPREVHGIARLQSQRLKIQAAFRIPVVMTVDAVFLQKRVSYR